MGQARQCILCGKCLEVCPMFAATGREELSPRAKFFLAQLMEGGEAGQDASERNVVALAGKCFSCGKCEKACPAGLSAPDLLSGLRAASPNAGAALWGFWISRARVLWPMMATLSRVLPRFIVPDAVKGVAAGLRALDPGEGLAPWLTPIRFDPCGQGRKAVVFPGCVAAHARPGWTATAQKIVRGLGFDVEPEPRFVCCGHTLGHVGLKDAQQHMRLANIERWRTLGRPMLAIFCATCRYGLHRYATADLGWEPGERETWTTGLVPLSELAARVEYEILPGAPSAENAGNVPAGNTAGGADDVLSGKTTGRVHYHTPCHDTDGKDAAFLRSVLGEALSAPTQKDLCCGFGGALKLEAPELSELAAKRCLDFYGPLPAERILSGCSGCVLQLRANAPGGVLVGHWLESIA